MKPYCFVLMPFGEKSDERGRLIDFDNVYAQIIKPAVEAADLEPVRADEEHIGGIIHKPMFARLMLCDYAVADLTTANANVLYELGTRHGVRPHSTVLIFARGMRLPFDVAPLRGLPYSLNDYGFPASAVSDRIALSERLNECRNPIEDSPLFQLLTDWPRPDLARLKTDQFRELIEYSQMFKMTLSSAREMGVDAVAAVEHELNVHDADPAIVVDLLLSYRAVKAWQNMLDLVSQMSPIVARAVLVREQVAFALSRLGRRREAERLLVELVEQHGSSSETNGLLGRVYKDMWEDARNAGRSTEAAGWLRKAIETYLSGYNADIRDAYPGVNAATLMELAEPVDLRQSELLPALLYAVKRRLSTTAPDYWDYATLLELLVLNRNSEQAHVTLGDALAHVRERWEPETTGRNLRLIREVRHNRGENVSWLAAIEDQLISAANPSG